MQDTPRLIDFWCKRPLYVSYIYFYFRLILFFYYSMHLQEMSVFDEQIQNNIKNYNKIIKKMISLYTSTIYNMQSTKYLIYVES